MSKNTKEVWKTAKGYKGRYQVSSLGRVRNKDEKVLAAYIRNGYSYVKLYKKGERKEWASHRLVAVSFMSNKKNKPVVNHLDGDRLNNKLSNLEWATFSENSKHAYATGLQTPQRGSDNKSSVLTKEQVVAMREMYSLDLFSYKTIGDLFQVSSSCAASAIKGKTWSTLQVTQ